VRHLTHRAIERSIVNEMPGTFEVIDEEEMVREIRSASGRDQRRPAAAQKQRDEHQDDARPRRNICDTWPALARQPHCQRGGHN
jgi:hypothetical protein